MTDLEELEQLESPAAFAQRVGLSFKNIRLLAQALTHRSYINEHLDAIGDNERLEFLGDAILDFLVGLWLYHHLPEMAEGRLTSLRAALVRNEQLADFARKLELGNALMLGRGEAESGGRERYSVLGSAFEAIVGALYIDSDLETVQAFIEPFLEDAVAEILIDNSDHDPKSRLQEYTQAKGMGTPVYENVSISGPDHQRQYVVNVLVNQQIVGTGNGHSKQAATKAAAQDALNKLGIVP
jgi:ribonuclease III